MGQYRQNLPQLAAKRFITDGGLETEMCFTRQIDLPEFAAYDLLRSETGRAALQEYYEDYLALAHAHEVGLLLETPTWRANRDWGEKIGDSPNALAAFNRAAVELLQRLRAPYDNEETPVVISGCIGPRGDGYSAASRMSVGDARDYHSEQIAVFADTEADMIGALTMNYVEEAIGIALAGKDHGMPVCISFTVETDGKLVGGDTVESAISAVDEATAHWPAYYMINCAHPTHFRHLFDDSGEWVFRLRGVRGNASKMSHAELDNSETLDDGNPAEFGLEVGELSELLPALNVLGGCCGTDRRHIEAICRHTA